MRDKSSSGSDPDTTGNVLVTFRSSALPEMLRNLEDGIGIREGQMARAEDLHEETAADGYDGLLFGGFGMMVLKRPMKEVRRLLRSSSTPVLNIRPEYRLRIPRWTATLDPSKPIDDRSGTIASEMLAEAGHSWALEVTGVSGLAPSVDGAGVKIALLDSGISPHSDIPAPVEAKSFVPSDPSVLDTLGHGTHCAGTLCGKVNPKKGARFGIAPAAQLYIARVTDAHEGSDETWVLQAIRWAISKGCRVISMSLGRPSGAQAAIDRDYDAVGEEAARHGAILIAAAGNESLRSSSRFSAVNQPAASSMIMAVGALTPTLTVYDASNRGTLQGPAGIDLAAPGTNVRSTWKDGGYRLMTGTSAATPVAAGIAALWMQQRPGMDVAAIWTHIRDNARALTNPQTSAAIDSRDVGAGLVRAPE